MQGSSMLDMVPRTPSFFSHSTAAQKKAATLRLFLTILYGVKEESSSGIHFHYIVD
jgi:hypothetical protein